jgi:tRNA threonylcarbamoyladenosine biosynthesis protein TsaB
LYPNAEFMLPLAHALFIQGKAQIAEQIQPVYLRDTVTWKKLPGRE